MAGGDLRGRAEEGGAPGGQLEDHHPQGVEVGGRAQGAGVELLGGAVLGGSGGLRHLAHARGGAEVEQPHPALVEKGVVGLEIEVEPARAVDRLHRVEEGGHQRLQGGRREASFSGLQQVAHRRAGQHLHGEEGAAAGGAPRIDGEGPQAFGESGQGGGLALQAPGGQARRCHLEGHAVAGGPVGEPDHAVPAFAQALSRGVALRERRISGVRRRWCPGWAAGVGRGGPAAARLTA